MSVKFEYPYASPTVELNLRNPDLGDSMQHDIQLQYGRAMNGGLYTYKYTPATRQLLMTFRHLTKAKVDELIDFLHQTSGRELKYTDYNSVENCIIFNTTTGILIETSESSYASNNIIINTMIYDNEIGITLFGNGIIQDNIINDCTIFNNSDYGIYSENVNLENSIYHNNLINNDQNYYKNYLYEGSIMIIDSMLQNSTIVGWDV